MKTAETSDISRTIFDNNTLISEKVNTQSNFQHDKAAQTSTPVKNYFKLLN